MEGRGSEKAGMEKEKGNNEKKKKGNRKGRKGSEQAGNELTDDRNIKGNTLGIGRRGRKEK